MVAWLLPFWFHVYFLAWLFIGGFYKETVWLIVAGVLSLLFGVALHIQHSKPVKVISSLQYA